MCLRNTKKHSLYLLLCSILLVSLLFGSLNLGLYADEVQEPSTEEDQKNWQYWNSGYSLVKDNTQGFLTRSFGFITDNSAGASIYNDAMNTLNDAWDALTEEEKARYDNDFRYYVGYQILGNRKGESVTPTEIDVQPEAQEAFQTAINVYVANNPLGYVEATIPSYTRLNTSQFSNYTVYKSVQEIIKNCNGYAIIQAPNQWDGTNSRYALMVTIPKETFEINFYGTVASGVFTSVQMEHNWANVSQFYPSSTNGIKLYRFYPNQAPVEYPNSGGNYWPNYNLVYNIASIRNGTGQGNIMTSLPKDETVFVFRTLNAYKNYNSGNPQPYYQAPSSMIDSNNTVSSITGSNNSYQYITNNIQSGMTGQEVLDLVALVMQKGSGSGSGSDDDDNPFGFLGKIGDLLSDLVSGVGGLLTDIVDGIVNVFLGTPNEDGEREGGLISTIKNVLNALTGLLSTNISDFLNTVFDWLPQEIRTIMLAGVTFTVFFGIWKAIRG